MKMTNKILFLAMLAIGSTTYAEIITPVDVVPSSEFAAAVNMINGSGLSGLGLHNNDENAMWQTFNLDTGTSIGETAEFILDNNYDLSTAIIWQYNGPNAFGIPEPDRELDEIELSVSPNLTDDYGDFVSLGTFNLRPAFDQLSPVGEPAQLFSLDGADNVRRVLLTINSVQGGVDDGTAGLSEVRFAGVIVPEPTAIALLLVSVLALFATRRP